MFITTPTTIEKVAWEGVLEPLGGALRSADVPPRVTIGEPVWWTAAQALASETGKTWTPPSDGRDYVLTRLACNLYPPSNERIRYTEMVMTAYLRPRQGGGKVFAHDLFPQKLNADDAGKFTFKLTPQLKFAEAIDVKLLEVGAEIEYHRAFPVIRGIGLGESRAEWTFQHHATHPLAGCQSVYLLFAAPQDADGVRLTIELLATMENRLGPVRYQLPRTMSANLSRLLEY